MPEDKLTFKRTRSVRNNWRKWKKPKWNATKENQPEKMQWTRNKKKLRSKTKFQTFQRINRPDVKWRWTFLEEMHNLDNSNSKAQIPHQKVRMGKIFKETNINNKLLNREIPTSNNQTKMSWEIHKVWQTMIHSDSWVKFQIEKLWEIFSIISATSIVLLKEI